jgi:hypothetical protein
MWPGQTSPLVALGRRTVSADRSDVEAG